MFSLSRKTWRPDPSSRQTSATITHVWQKCAHPHCFLFFSQLMLNTDKKGFSSLFISSILPDIFTWSILIIYTSGCGKCLPLKVEKSTASSYPTAASNHQTELKTVKNCLTYSNLNYPLIIIIITTTSFGSIWKCEWPYLFKPQRLSVETENLPTLCLHQLVCVLCASPLHPCSRRLDHVFICGSHRRMCDPSSWTGLTLRQQTEQSAPLHHPLLWAVFFFFPFSTVNLWNTSCFTHLDGPPRCAHRRRIRSTRLNPSRVPLFLFNAEYVRRHCVKAAVSWRGKDFQRLTQGHYCLRMPYY